MTSRECYVYVVGSSANDKVCKIGVSYAPETRLAGLQPGSFSRLFLFANFAFEDKSAAHDAERFLHSELTEVGLCGEWFAVSPADASMMIKGLAGEQN